MAFDLFISHSRRDDLDGRLTQLIERLKHEFEKIHGRELKVFFDTSDVRGRLGWYDVLPAVRKSRLFLAFLTTSYLESDHCEWDLNEYLKSEITRGLAGDGIVVVDAIDWTRWPKEGLNQTFVERFRDVRRRRNFEFHGELEKPEALHQLASQISRLIRLIERSENSRGNIDPFNPHFTGRSSELEHIRESLALGKLCVLSGAAGIGKTSIAVEYAHAYAGEYGGGRWQVSCRAKRSPSEVVDSPELREVHKHGLTRDKRCLLILDDVTDPGFLIPTELRVAGDADWLHVIVTTRLGEQHLAGGERDRSLFNVQGLPEADAIQLIETFQPIRADFERRTIQRQLASLVDGFPFAIETASAAARHFPTLSLEHFMEPLRKAKSGNTSGDQKHIVTALLKPILSVLSATEIEALRLTSQFDDSFDLSKISRQVPFDYSDWKPTDEKPGFPSTWQTLLNNLFSLRLWKPTNEVAANFYPRTAQMHSLWRRTIQQLVPPPRIENFKSIKPSPIAPRANFDFKRKAARFDYTIDAEFIEIDRITGREIRSVHPLDDNVMFTVYRRKTLVPNKWYPLLAFAHLSERRPDAPPDEPDPVVAVTQQAQAILGAAFAAFKESTEDSSQPIPRSGELMFKPSVPGVEFNPPSRTFKWEESVHREEFKMRASPELDGQVTRGCLRVFLGPIIVAEVNLAFKVGSITGATDTTPDLIDKARPFRKVFASYSHKDTAIVEQIEKLVHDSHLGLEYLRDVTKLRSGEEWNESLLQMIDSADLFQLFWSTNSMRSEYVKREYERALARRLPGFVRPVYWEQPFPERPEEGLPPENLKRLHFEKLGIGDVTLVSKPPVAESETTRSRRTASSREETRRDPVITILRHAREQIEGPEEARESAKREMEGRRRRFEVDNKRVVESRSPKESGARYAEEVRRDKYSYPPASGPMSYSPMNPANPRNRTRSGYGGSSLSPIFLLVAFVSLLATLLFIALKIFGVVHSWMAVLICSIIFLVSFVVFIIRD